MIDIFDLKVLVNFLDGPRPGVQDPAGVFQLVAFLKVISSIMLKASIAWRVFFRRARWSGCQ